MLTLEHGTIITLSISAIGLALPGISLNQQVNVASNTEEIGKLNELDDLIQLNYVETVEEVFNENTNDGLVTLNSTNVNRSEMTNAEAIAYVEELRDFGNGTIGWAKLLSNIPVLGLLLDWGLFFTNRQALDIADQVEAANQGNGVVQVINLDTGAYTFETR